MLPVLGMVVLFGIEHKRTFSDYHHYGLIRLFTDLKLIRK
jgi:hypothetical protein